MPKSPDTLNEEIIVAVALLKSATAEELRKKLLPNYSRAGITKGLRRLQEAGYLIMKEIKTTTGKIAHTYTRTDKEYTYSSPNVVKAPALPVPPTGTHKTGILPSKKTEDPSQPDYWLSRLDEVIRGLTELKEAIPVVLTALLDISRDLERLSKVKEILNGASNVVRKNL